MAAPGGAGRRDRRRSGGGQLGDLADQHEIVRGLTRAPLALHRDAEDVGGPRRPRRGDPERARALRIHREQSGRDAVPQVDAAEPQLVRPTGRGLREARHDERASPDGLPQDLPARSGGRADGHERDHARSPRGQGGAGIRPRAEQPRRARGRLSRCGADRWAVRGWRRLRPACDRGGAGRGSAWRAARRRPPGPVRERASPLAGAAVVAAGAGAGTVAGGGAGAAGLGLRRRGRRQPGTH